jgi:hypothetical protein
MTGHKMRIRCLDLGRRRRGVVPGLLGVLGLVAVASFAAASEEYSRAVGREHPTRVFWGDTHVHSSWSNDANLMGNQSLTPAEAYRFARGETVTASGGMKAALDRPLDFLVVADHSEYLGLLPALRSDGCRRRR